VLKNFRKKALQKIARRTECETAVWILLLKKYDI